MKYSYKHIINDVIETIETPHPLEKKYDKTEFIEILMNDLNISKSDVQEISGAKNNLFRIFYKNLYYNVFIEFPDGGGRDISKNQTSKKISIPYGINAFKKLIIDYERVLVINVYVPLDENQIPDYSRRVYLIVDPMEIYLSKVVKTGTWNPSSRWVKLEKMLDIIKNEIYGLNNEKNVFIVHKNKIEWVFDNILIERYIAMINTDIKISLSDLSNGSSEKFKKYRKVFRELLILNRGVKCEINNCKMRALETMIASHIKPVNKIVSDEHLDDLEKITEISDPCNGLLLCANHDKLFDGFLITFNDKGILQVSTKIIDKINDFNLVENAKTIDILDNRMIKYLKFHNDEFFSRENNHRLE